MGLGCVGIFVSGELQQLVFVHPNDHSVYVQLQCWEVALWQEDPRKTRVAIEVLLSHCESMYVCVMATCGQRRQR